MIKNYVFLNCNYSFGKANTELRLTCEESSVKLHYLHFTDNAKRVATGRMTCTSGKQKNSRKRIKKSANEITRKVHRYYIFDFLLINSYGVKN